jgi:hypothetical protein
MDYLEERSERFSICDEEVMESDNSVNLIIHRSDVDVWQRRARRSSTIEEWLGPWVVRIAGASLLAYGTYRATRRSRRGGWWMVSGVSLLVCGAAGLVNPHRLRARWTRSFEQAPVDLVMQESLDSFPASDAPSSNATTTNPRPL